MNRKVRTLFLFLIGLTVLLIWGNSLLSSRNSYAISNFVSNLLTRFHMTGLVAWLSFLGKSQGSQVRKAAHLAEFAIYGFLIRLFIRKWGGNSVTKGLAIALFGVSTALIDETIQLFTNRTSSVKDIWIDLAGYCAGAAVSTIVLLLYNKIRSRMRTYPKA